MNVVVSIGCNKYERLSLLQGAEQDAADVFTMLTSPKQLYDPKTSVLLHSPGKAAVLSTLDSIFVHEIGVFTFFFAGHAVVKAGSFYLCTYESDPGRLSTSSFPIVDLFSIVNEFSPRQVNIVIDACEAGGAALDLTQLLKPEVIGSSQASSITFLGACSSDQFASETAYGGTLTRELLKCLNGERKIQNRSPALDLTEIAAVVCQEVRLSHPDQTPISWGLSLFGDGRFAQNPHFDKLGTEEDFPVRAVRPDSIIGRQIRAISPLLWQEYRAFKAAPCPRRLLDVLDRVSRSADAEVSELVSFLEGIGTTFKVRAAESRERLAPSQCLATCGVSVLRLCDSPQVQQYIRRLLKYIIASDLELWRDLLPAIRADDGELLAPHLVLADLYYLPLRVTNLLGWLATAFIFQRLFPDLSDGHNSLRWDLAHELLLRYKNSIAAVSDEQAPALYVFLTACLLEGQRHIAEQCLNLHFASFAERRGNITRVRAEGSAALSYLLSLANDTRAGNWRPANPSQLLSVLLLMGGKLSLGKDWDLRALDRKYSGFFVPSNYRSFAENVIEDGTNYTHQIGFGVWGLDDFRKEFNRIAGATFAETAVNLPKEGTALCALASLLFPDRIPLVLELIR